MLTLVPCSGWLHKLHKHRHRVYKPRHRLHKHLNRWYRKFLGSQRLWEIRPP